jgi:acylphosphatase
MKKAIRIFIFGTVQSVFFRNFIKENADKLNIMGYARNKDDGSVECWLEGDQEKVEKLIEICRVGPKESVIKRLDRVEEKFQGFKNFKVIYF